MSADMQQRIAGAAESILGNETLTATLDDQSADLFLNWALARAEEIAKSTAGLDDQAAEEIMYPRLKAIRGIGRQLGRWSEDPQSSFENILTQAQIVIGSAFNPPDEPTKAAFMQNHTSSSSAILIPALIDILK
jgi:hypothetical protein